MQETISINQMDAILGEAGQFSCVEWLLGANHLPYGAYEQWRRGEVEYLTEVIGLDTQALEELVQRVSVLARDLKLAEQEQTYYAWHKDMAPLKLARGARLNQGLGQMWKRPEDMPQLDLFMDNAAVVCENQVQLDLAAKSVTQARASLQKLTQLNPGNEKLGAYQDLINYAEHCEAHVYLNAEEVEEELQGLMGEVAPLAKDALNHYARDYLAGPWRRLAEALPQTECHQWPLHSTYALSQIPDWAAVQTHAESCNHLYTTTELMALLATAYFYSQDPGKGYLMWGLIAERFPDYADVNLPKAGIALTELWDGFLAFDEHWPNEWFLGYLMIQKPGLVHSIEALPSRAGAPIKTSVNQTVAALVYAKLMDEDQSLHRAQLKTLAPVLLRCFMNKRDWFVSGRSG